MVMTTVYQRIDVKNLQDKTIKYKLSLIKPLIFEGRSFVAGGVFKSVFDEEEEFSPKDIDVFFYTADDHTKMMSKFSKLSGLENPPYVYSHANVNSISYTNVETKIDVDLVMREYGTPDHILSGFDFTCVQCAAVIENGEYRLVYHPQFLEGVRLKVLYYDCRGEFNPDGVFNRIIKYARTYGYTPSLELKTKLFSSIKLSQDESPLSDPKITKY
jgi:hypothetical protein